VSHCCTKMSVVTPCDRELVEEMAKEHAHVLKNTLEICVTNVQLAITMTLTNVLVSK